MPEYADWVVRGSAILAVLAYLLRYWKLAVGNGFGYDRFSQVSWTIAWILLLGHSFAAMHLAHRWNLSAAWEHTAEQTAAVTGWRWGGGLVINVLLLVLWGTDVTAWNAFGRPLLRRWPVADKCWQAIVAFLMFNATVVFGPSYWFAIFAVGGLGLGPLGLRLFGSGHGRKK